MTLVSFQAALEHADEIELTTTGRVTGKPISCPVRFVRHGEKLYLVPGDETGSQWYKNLLKTPAVRPPARRARCSATGTPVTDPSMFTRILEYFRAKYGTKNAGSLYPHPNIAVEIPPVSWLSSHMTHHHAPERRPLTG